MPAQMARNDFPFILVHSLLIFCGLIDGCEIFTQQISLAHYQSLVQKLCNEIDCGIKSCEEVYQNYILIFVHPGHKIVAFIYKMHIGPKKAASKRDLSLSMTTTLTTYQPHPKSPKGKKEKNLSFSAQSCVSSCLPQSQKSIPPKVQRTSLEQRYVGMHEML